MSRDIDRTATVLRLVVGAALLGVSLLVGPTWWDLGAALVLYPLLAVLLTLGLTRVVQAGFVRQAAATWSGREAAASLAVGVIVLGLGVLLTFVSPVDGTSLYLFFGASMVLAAAKGYAGCEVLALPNLLLGRRDAVWCVLFSPLDRRSASARRR